MKETEKSERQPEGESGHKRREGRAEAVNNVIDSMTLVNRSYVYEFASEAYCQAHGRSRKDIVGNSVAHIWGEANFNRFLKKHLDFCFMGNVVHYENWLEFPGQEHRCYRVSYSPYFNHDGEVTHAVVTSLDITDTKKEEEALEKSEAHFRTILKSMHYGVLTFNRDGNFTFVNDTVVKRSGYPREWYVGKCLFDMVRPEERETVRSHFEATVRGEQVPPYEFAYSRAGGDTAYVHISTTAIREGVRIVGVLALLLDITKRRESEQALKESEKKYRALFEESRDAIYITSREGKLVDVNHSFLKLFGFAPEEVDKINIIETYADPEDRKVFQQAIEEKGFVEDFSLKMKKKDGSLMECLLTGTTRRKPDGTVEGYQGIIRDESDKMRAKADLRDSEQKMKSILYGSPIPQFVIDKNHRVTHWNRALKMLTGLDAEEVTGTNQHWKAFYGAQRPCIADLMVDEAIGEIPDWYGGKFSKSNIVNGAYRATDFFPAMGKGGKWLYFTASVIRDAKGDVVGALETLEDVTQQRLAGEVLREAAPK